MTGVLQSFAAVNPNFSVVSPVPLTSASVLSDYIQFFGVKSFGANGVLAGNSNLAYVGTESGKLPYVIPTGGLPLTLAFPKTERQSLANFWVSAQSGDGIYAIAY
jgi:hypothetical protein